MIPKFYIIAITLILNYILFLNVSNTESILQSPGNISYTFTMHSTNSSTIVATSSSSGTVTSSKDISSTQILIIASCTIGSIVLCLVFMVICLIVTIKLQRGRQALNQIKNTKCLHEV